MWLDWAFAGLALCTGLGHDGWESLIYYILPMTYRKNVRLREINENLLSDSIRKGMVEGKAGDGDMLHCP